MDTGKNKSSILKPQKPRNPLSDLDFVEPVKVESPLSAATTTTTIQRRSSLRRVSFASSNFVKEFATDPETHTVLWDTTYEENINKSDSTNDSTEPNQTNKCPDLGIQTGTATVKIVDSSNIPCVAVCSEAAIEINVVESQTSIKNDNRKASINFNEEGGEDIESDSSLCGTEVCENRIIETVNCQLLYNKNVNAVTQQTVQIEKLNIISRHTQSNKLQGLPSNTDNLPCTSGFSQTLKLNVADKENIPTLSTTLPPILSHRRFCQITTAVDDHYSTLEFTKPISGFTRINENKSIFSMNPQLSVVNQDQAKQTSKIIAVDENMEFTEQFVKDRSDLTNKTNLMERSMEFTKSISAFNPLAVNLNSSHTFRKNNESRSGVEEQNMEITQQLPVFKYGSDKSNKTIMMDESIDVTESLPVFNPLAVNSIQLSHKNNKTRSGQEQMEFTQQLPVFKYGSDKSNKTIMMDESIDVTESLPVFNPLAVNSSQLSHKNNKTRRGEEQMEFTQQLPVFKYGSDKSNKTIMMDESIDVTESLPVFNPLAVNSIQLSHKNNKTRSGQEQMEFTQQLPVFKYGSDKSNKTIMMDESIDFTESLPVFNPLAVHSSQLSHKNNKTRRGEEQMEFTQQLPVFKYGSDKSNKTIMMDDSIDVTESLPVFNPLAVNSSQLSHEKSKTRSGEEQKLKFTQQLPVFKKDPGVTNKTIMINESTDVTKSLPVYNPLAVNSNQLSHKNNKTRSGEEQMQFTLQLPIFKNGYDQSNKTIMMDESIDVTKSLPVFNPLTVNSSQLSHKNNQTRSGEVQNMEFTQQLPVFKEDPGVTNKTIMMNESIDVTKSLPVFNPLTVNSSQLSHKNNKTISGEEQNMEFTQQLPDFKYGSDQRNKTIMMDESIDVTKSVPVFNPLTVNSSQLSHKNNQTRSGEVQNMEFTQQLPVFKEDPGVTNKTIMMNESIDVTKSLPVFNPLTVNSSQLSHKNNKTISGEEQNMEFTRQLPDFKYGSDQRNKTIMMDESIDVTKSVPVFNPLTVNSSQLSHKNNQTRSGEVQNMEFTQQLPVFKEDPGVTNKTIMMNESIDVTKSLPVFNPLTVNSSQLSHKNNKTISGEEQNMEFKQQLPDFKYGSDQRNKTIMMDESIDVTKSVPVFNPLTVNSSQLSHKNNKTISGEEQNMEFKQQLPDFKYGSDQRNKTIMMDESIDVTKSVPVFNPLTVNSSQLSHKNNKTISGEEQTMEFTQQLSDFKYGSDQRNKTIMMDESIDVTKSVPVFNRLTVNSSQLSHKNNQTRSGEVQNMKFTQQLPVFKEDPGATNKTIMMNESIDVTKSLPVFNPLTVNSSQLSHKNNKTISGEEQNMEFTRQLPDFKYGSDQRNKTIMMDESIDVTKSVPVFNPLTVNSSQLSHKNNKTISGEEQNMEFKQQLPDFKYGSDQRNKTSMMDESIDVTKSVPVFNPLTVNSSQLSHKNNKTISGEEQTMEFTQQLSDFKYGSDQRNKTIMMDESIDVTKSVPVFNPLTVNSSQFSHKNNKTISGEEQNMEFTQQLPVFKKDPVVTNKTIMMNESINVTKSLPVFNPLAVNSNQLSHSNNKTRSCEERAQQLNVFKYDSDQSNKTIITNESIDVTKSIPVSNPLAVNSSQLSYSNNKTRSCEEEQSLELAQQLPLFKSSSDPSSKSIIIDQSIEDTKLLPAFNPLMNKTKSFMQEENVEYTKQLPIVENSSDPSKNTIKIEESVELTLPLITSKFVKDENMEFTQQLPILINSPGTKALPALDPLVTETNSRQLLCEVSKTASYVKEENIKVTQQLSLFKNTSDPNSKTIMKNQSTEDTKSVPAINPLVKNKTCSFVQEKSMEFTKQLPVVKNSPDPNNKTITKEESVKFTQPSIAFKSLALSHTNKPLIKDDVNKSIAGSSYTTVMDQSLEFTKSLPAFDPLMVDTNSSKLLCKDSKTRSNVEESNMKFAHQLPLLETSSGPKGEYKKSLPDVKPLVKRQGEAFTKQLPLVKNSPDSRNKKTNRMKESVKFTQARIAFKSLVHNCNNTSLIKDDVKKNVPEDENMEFIEQLPAAIALNSKSKMDKSIEFTKSELASQLVAHIVNSINKVNLTDDKNINAIADRTIDFKQQLHSFDPQKKTNVMEDCIQISRMDTQTNKTTMKTENLERKTVCSSKSVIPHYMKLVENSKEADLGNFKNSVLNTPKRFVHSYMSLSPGIDDTQHLINCSLGDEQPNSDFSKIITGDLSPSFISPKFMHLSEFGSEAFPVSLESTRYNQTQMELDHEEFDNESSSTIPVSKDTQINQTKLEEDKKDYIFSGCTAAVDDHIYLEQVELVIDKNCKKLHKDECEKNNPGAINKLKRRSVENMECPTNCKKPMLDYHKDNAGDENMEISFTDNAVLNISQESITLSDTVTSINETGMMSCTNNTLLGDAKELIANLTQSIVNTTLNSNMHKLYIRNKNLEETYRRRIFTKQRIEDFTENITKSLAVMTQKSLKLSELFDEEIDEISRPIKVPSVEDVKSVSDSSPESSFEPVSPDLELKQSPHFLTDSNLTIEVEKVLTLREKIEEKQTRCKGYWILLSLQDDNCKFNTLYKTIEFTVQFNKETGIVNRTDMCYNIPDTAKKTSFFVHKILKDRLSQKSIQSAVGEHYDILTLLDYVYLHMEKMLGILGEFRSFAKRFNMQMDENFRVTFKMVILEIQSTWLITVDLSDIENITQDSVTAFAKIGTVNEVEIKSFVQGCPQGLLFLNKFISNVMGYIQLLKKRANFKKILL